jgi:hypothetical protein
MRYRIHVFLIAIVINLLPRITIAQTDWLSNFTIKESLDPKKAPRPALLQLVKPAGDSGSYAVSIGIRYGFSTALLSIGPFVEWQKLSAESTPQDVVKEGIAGDYMLWDLADEKKPQFVPLILSEVNLKQDRLKDIKSLQAAVSSTLLFRGCAKAPRCLLRPNVITEVPAFAFRYLPYVGVEYEARLSGSEQPKRVVRELASVQSQLYPFARAFDYRLQLTADYTYRHGNKPETSKATKDHRRFDGGVNVFLLKRQREEEPNRTVAVGLSYVNGADPSNGLEPQEVTKLGFKIQF